MLETIKQSLIVSNDENYFADDEHVRFLNECPVPLPERRMNMAKMGWAKQRTAGCLPFALHAMRIAGSKGAWVQRIIQGVLSIADLIPFYTGQKMHSFVFLSEINYSIFTNKGSNGKNKTIPGIYSVISMKG